MLKINDRFTVGWAATVAARFGLPTAPLEVPVTLYRKNAGGKFHIEGDDDRTHCGVDVGTLEAVPVTAAEVDGVCARCEHRQSLPEVFVEAAAWASVLEEIDAFHLRFERWQSVTPQWSLFGKLLADRDIDLAEVVLSRCGSVAAQEQARSVWADIHREVQMLADSWRATLERDLDGYAREVALRIMDQDSIVISRDLRDQMSDDTIVLIQGEVTMWVNAVRQGDDPVTVMTDSRLGSNPFPIGPQFVWLENRPTLTPSQDTPAAWLRTEWSTHVRQVMVDADAILRRQFDKLVASVNGPTTVVASAYRVEPNPREGDFLEVIFDRAVRCTDDGKVAFIADPLTAHWLASRYSTQCGVVVPNADRAMVEAALSLWNSHQGTWRSSNVGLTFADAMSTAMAITA